MNRIIRKPRQRWNSPPNRRDVYRSNPTDYRGLGVAFVHECPTTAQRFSACLCLDLLLSAGVDANSNGGSKWDGERERFVGAYGPKSTRTLTLVAVLAFLLTFSASAIPLTPTGRDPSPPPAPNLPPASHNLTEADLTRISFDQKLNSQASLDLAFRDEDNHAVKLGDYFGQKPTILVLGYYECPMLCTLVFNGMVEALQDLRWSIGREFQVIHVSIDPRETPALAAAKKATYLKRYGRTGAAAGWHFLTGNETAIRQLAGEVGFQYAYDPATRQFAHPSGLIILTPGGKVARYAFGVTFAPRDLLTALQTAAGNRIGSPVERLILLCFHYNPLTGKYGPAILLSIRIVSGIFVLALGWWIWVLSRPMKLEGPKVPESRQPANTTAASRPATAASSRRTPKVPRPPPAATSEESS